MSVVQLLNERVIQQIIALILMGGMIFWVYQHVDVPNDSKYVILLVASWVPVIIPPILIPTMNRGNGPIVTIGSALFIGILVFSTSFFITAWLLYRGRERE